MPCQLWADYRCKTSFAPRADQLNRSGPLCTLSARSLATRPTSNDTTGDMAALPHSRDAPNGHHAAQNTQQTVSPKSPRRRQPFQPDPRPVNTQRRPLDVATSFRLRPSATSQHRNGKQRSGQAPHGVRRAAFRLQGRTAACNSVWHTINRPAGSVLARSAVHRGAATVARSADTVWGHGAPAWWPWVPFQALRPLEKWALQSQPRATATMPPSDHPWSPYLCMQGEFEMP